MTGVKVRRCPETIYGEWGRTYQCQNNAKQDSAYCQQHRFKHEGGEAVTWYKVNNFDLDAVEEVLVVHVTAKQLTLQGGATTAKSDRWYTYFETRPEAVTYVTNKLDKRVQGTWKEYDKAVKDQVKWIAQETQA